MIVHTDTGRVEGITREVVTAFKGIPYAAPPVGALRWKPPQPVATWKGVRQADTFGKACIQPVSAPADGAEPVAAQSEDCLYLNVWTTGQGHRKPVMVWIHGGGLQSGDGASARTDGAALARDGAVVVTMNYRLGHLGFFAHPALEREYPAGLVNFGLLDQIAALGWVQRNITGFGGDPSNVTIFGAAAGAASVLALFASPMATGLFHKGVAQSAYAIPEHTRAHAVAVGFDVANRGLGLGNHATLAQLLAVPAAAFAQRDVALPSLAPVAVVGDDILPRRIRDTFYDGEEQRLPLILGSTSDDASACAAFGIDPVALLAMVRQRAGASTLDVLKGLYQEDPELQVPEDLIDPSRLGGVIARDLLFTMHARWLAQHHSKRAAARRYYFSYVPERMRVDQPRGVPHGGDIVFPFNTGDVALSTGGWFTDRDRQMARIVSHYWFSFAQTGTPTGPVAWPLHQLNGLLVNDRVLKLGETIEAQANFRRTRLEIFASKYPELAVGLARG